jgi:hypothetical protein
MHLVRGATGAHVEVGEVIDLMEAPMTASKSPTGWLPIQAPSAAALLAIAFLAFTSSRT